MKNKMSDLRNHLFETLEALKDQEHPMEIARAHAVSHVARTIIESAKMEIQFLKLTERDPVGNFFGDPPRAEPARLLTAERPTKLA